MSSIFGTILVFFLYVYYLGLTPEELSRLAATGTRGWLSTDHVTWVLNELNSMQQDTMLLCPNAVANIPNEMARKRKHFNFGMIRRLVMPLNVGKRASGETFIGGVNDSGDHWALVIVELRPYKRIIYCDTLALDPPSILVEVVNSYTSHIPRIGDFTESNLSVAHSRMATSRHLCDWRCRNYPLQTCSDICGVIVLINAALASLHRSFFQYLIGPYQKEKIFLQRPTQHSYSLRRVLMAWFAEGRIDIDYVLPKEIDSHQSGIPSNFDHTCCFRQDTSINSRRKLNLSLNHHTKVTKDQSKESSPISPSAGSTARGKLTNSKSSNNTNTLSGSDPEAKTPTLPKCTKGSDASSGEPTPSKRVRKQKKSDTNSNSGKKEKSPTLSKCTKSSDVSTEGTSKGVRKQGVSKNDVKESKDNASNSESKPKSQKPKAPVSSDCTNTSSNEDLSSTEGPSTSTSRNPASSAKGNAAHPAPTDHDSAPVAETSKKFQCEHCGLQLSGRNCLYKHKLRKHKGENAKKVQSKHVVCPDCKEDESR